MRLQWKQSVVVIVISALWAVSAGAEHNGHQHEGGVQKKNSVETPANCQLCGMDRAVFNYSRVLVTYADGSSTGTCSINCAHEVLTKNPAKKVKSIQVADYGTKKLIDAKGAVWVVGGKKQGVMSPVATWAFSKKKDAEKFVKDFGGKIRGFDEVWKAAAP